MTPNFKDYLAGRLDEASLPEQTLDAVWEKGEKILGKDPGKFRADVCGALMQRDKYGNRKHVNGWEVDHIKPKSKGGSNDLKNLQPLQWENNRDKDNDYPTSPSSYCITPKE